ncbi:unnamed protein product, partial [Ectocarpus sp. 13 AM-2016]
VLKHGGIYERAEHHAEAARPYWVIEGEMDPRPATRMRKSCCACGRKKKKCDGFMPCRRCVDSGSRCVYEKRRCHLPLAHHEQ